VGAQGLSPIVCCLRSFPPLGSGLSPECCWPSCHLFTDGSCKFGSLPLPALWCSFSNPCPLHCALVFSSIVCSVFFFLQGGSVCPGGLCWFIPQMAEGYHVTLRFHLFGLPHIWSQWPMAGGQWPAAVWGWQPTCSLKCIMAWRRFPQARGSECQSFNSPWCFTSAKCGSSISARSLIHAPHAVCICVSQLPFWISQIFLFNPFCQVVSFDRGVEYIGIQC
jgi:hypothetical protein